MNCSVCTAMRSDPNFILAWIWMLLGFVAGMVLGTFFQNENWLGGYSSFRRRMVRLGTFPSLASAR